MTISIRAIYQRGLLHPLDDLELEEGAEVVLLVKTTDGKTKQEHQTPDPLAGIRFASGKSDLAQNSDSYRFGKK